MSLASFMRQFGRNRSIMNRIITRSLVSTRMMSVQTQLTYDTSNVSRNTSSTFSSPMSHSSTLTSSTDPREMNIEFLVSLFQKLHSRNLLDVMNETLADYSLSKQQTMAILDSNMFLSLNEQIVIALLQNKALVRDNVKPEELWGSLKKWCQNHVANRPARTPSPFHVSRDKEREWLEVMKVYLPYIDFDSMNAKFFIENVEPIPDSYAILSRDRKYRIMKQHCLNLIKQQEETQLNINNNNTDNSTQGTLVIQANETNQITSTVLSSIRQPNEIVPEGFAETVPILHQITTTNTVETGCNQNSEDIQTETNDNDNETVNTNQYQRLDRDLYGQPLSY